ncbi:Centaurin-gamma-1A [Fasciolopsis buskii]|uniref:Centaurin-gamma-1A n=1 Tax=Fasciolopsis buskii TaxID=27845 RepID=A0A8E0VJM9_9TREM|nr:Centaurin-gamma-1A [Fasciolopsis buski]
MNLASYLIKGEINRFECVHPYIYASYDILDGMRDVELSNRIRDHLISIEDAFVHSQEWTLSRDVSEIKIAFLGSPSSGKSGLIHFFLTGVYVQDESPEDGLVSGPSAPAVEFHVRHLLNSMNWCPYHETCAVYGLNVEPVFQESKTLFMHFIMLCQLLVLIFQFFLMA